MVEFVSVILRLHEAHADVLEVAETLTARTLFVAVKELNCAPVNVNDCADEPRATYVNVFMALPLR
jgi:hypothetical protein